MRRCCSGTRADSPRCSRRSRRTGSKFIENALEIDVDALADGVEIRKAANAMNVLLLTTLSAAIAAVSAIQAMSKKELKYRSSQNHFWNWG